MKNIKDLREDLVKRYEEAKTENDKKDLASYTKTASAIIRTLKVEMDYNKVKGVVKTIDFLETDESM